MEAGKPWLFLKLPAPNPERKSTPNLHPNTRKPRVPGAPLIVTLTAVVQTTSAKLNSLKPFTT